MICGGPVDGMAELRRHPLPRYPKADEGMSWDAGAEVKKAEIADLKKMCAWYGGTGENKTDYKLPHHKVTLPDLLPTRW